MLIDIKFHNHDDVYDSIWIAVAILAYNDYLCITNKINKDNYFYFKQIDIKNIARKVCLKKINPARINQSCNGDSIYSRYNYLRKNGKLMRLTIFGEFNGHNEIPNNSKLNTTVILADKNNNLLNFNDLVYWVKNVYPKYLEQYQTYPLEF